MLPTNSALLVIDMQKAIDHPSWGRRNNPQAEENISRLLSAWRESEKPIIHIRHVSEAALVQTWVALGRPITEIAPIIGISHQAAYQLSQKSIDSQLIKGLVKTILIF
jgi:nicotinamidase-related amidase